MRTIIRGLCVEDDDTLRRAILRVTRPDVMTGVEIQWDEAASAKEAFELVAKSAPRVALVDMALVNDPQNCDGLYVAYAAHEAGAHTFVLTGRHLEDWAQLELHKLGIPVFTKPFRSELIVDALVSAAMEAPKPRLIPSIYSLAHIANLIRRIDGRTSEVVKQIVAIIADDAMKETNNNKSQAAKLLEEERGFIDRALAYLPRKKAG